MNKGNSIMHFCPIRRVGAGPHHHFFGYYNKNVWDRTGRYFLSNRVPMMTADLTGKEVAEVGFFDLESNDEYHVLGETTTWNWQMGCQLQWLEGEQDRQIIYNSRRSDVAGPGAAYPDFCSTLYNVESGEERTLPLPVYLVAPNSRFALSVDYSRFQVTHRTIGYVASGAELELENAPANDGIHHMDIATGESKLVLSLRDLRDFQRLKFMDKAIHWVTHMEVNPGSSRILFIHRWTERVEDEFCFLHRLFTMNPDGNWLLSDTYPDDVTNERLLILYDAVKGQRYDIGSFYTDPNLGKENRCDLHPRWSPDGRQVCIDSVHEGARQRYIIDVGELTRPDLPGRS